jgi:Xaa-Pro aminopeptidase
VLVLFSAPPRIYSRDIEYEYRQDSNLYYLSGVEQQDTVLVLLPGNPSCKEALFVKPRDPAREHWQGTFLSREQAGAASGIDTVYLTSQFDAFIEALLSGRPFDGHMPQHDPFLKAVGRGSARVALVLDPKDWYGDDSSPVHVFAQRMKERYPSLKLEDASEVLRDLRQVKTPYEQAVLRKCLQITCEGHRAGMRKARPGLFEYEVEAAIEAVYKSNGAEGPAYPSIVASGPNASTLHYTRSNRRMEEGDLLVVDSAAHYRYMAGDVTRTYPVNGRFTPAQRDIYDIVLAAQDAGRKAARLGVRPGEIHEKVTAVLQDGLYRLGLITDKSGSQYKLWSTHGTCHYIGLDVHDVGDSQKALAPGMAFTIEPGIYIRPEAIENLPPSPEREALISRIRAAFDKYRGIAVRIEDSFLMTETGLECMSKSLPRTVEEVESAGWTKFGLDP